MRVYKEQDYWKYLDIQTKSAYISGLKKVYILFEEKHFWQSLDDYIKSAICLSNESSEAFEQLTKPIENWLTLCKSNSNTEYEKKFYSNSISYLRKYLQFIQTELSFEKNKELFNNNTIEIDKVDNSKEFYMHKEYKQWLINNTILKDNSINSYLSTLRSINVKKWLGDDCNINLLFLSDNEPTEKATEDAILSVNELIAKLNTKIWNLLDSNEAKILSDYRSHLRKYLSFLEEKYELFLEYSDNIEDNSIESLESKSPGYGKKELFNIFKNRFLTEDICPINKENTIFYPIRIISKIIKDFFYLGNNPLHSIIQKEIDNIEIAIDAKGNIIEFKDIDSLEINDNGNVFVYSNSKKYPVYTTKNNGETWDYMTAKDIYDIHIRPLYIAKNKVLEELGTDKLPIISEMTKDLRNIQIKYDTKTNSELANRFFKNENYVNKYKNKAKQILEETSTILNNFELILKSNK